GRPRGGCLQRGRGPVKRAAMTPCRSSRARALMFACGLACGACTRDATVALVVVSADGGDPFLPPDGATQARVIVEDDATVPRTEPVRSGAFVLNVDPVRPEVASRVVLQALAGGVVVGSGATPALVWQAIG